jgi:hypothetical protein
VPCRQRDLFYKYLWSAVRFCASGAVVLIRVYRCVFTLRIYFFSFFTLEFVQCRGDIVAGVLRRMSIVPHSTLLCTRSEKWVWHCAFEPAFRWRIMYEMCDAVWWWSWMLPRTSQVARKERTRTVMCYCGHTPVPVHVPVISASRRCVGFIGRRRRQSPELNELKRSGALTHV